MIKLLTAFLITFALAALEPGSARAQNWMEVRPPGAGYRVLMPGAPTRSMANVPLGGGRSTTMHQETFETDEAAFLSTHVDYPADLIRGSSPDQLVRNVRDGSAKGHTLRSDRAFTVGGQPARDYVIVQASGVILVTRSVLVGNRLYQIIVARMGVEAHPDTTRFLDSFALTAR